MANLITKKTSLKILASLLLASLILSTPTHCGTENNNNKETQAAQESDFKKVAKKVGLYIMGTITAGSCILSLTGLYIFVTSLKDIKSSYTKNAAFAAVKKAIQYFSSAPQLNKYIIPGIIYGLSANALMSLVGSVWSFTAGYKTKISVTDYAKYTVLPKILEIPQNIKKILGIKS